MDNQNTQNEISKIKINNQTYDIKDAETRRLLIILLGEKSIQNSPQSSK